MKKEHYCYQKFLFIDDLSKINLKNVSCPSKAIFDYTEERNLFDVTDVARYVKVSELDETIDTKEDFDLFIKKLAGVNTLWLINDRPVVDNPIYNDFSELVIKSYIDNFQKCGVNVFLDSNK